MDIWERMYEKAKEQYHPEEVSPFIYAHNVVCAIEAENVPRQCAKRRWERYAMWCLSGILLSIK